MQIRSRHIRSSVPQSTEYWWVKKDKYIEPTLDGSYIVTEIGDIDLRAQINSYADEVNTELILERSLGKNPGVMADFTQLPSNALDMHTAEQNLARALKDRSELIAKEHARIKYEQAREEKIHKKEPIKEEKPENETV